MPRTTIGLLGKGIRYRPPAGRQLKGRMQIAFPDGARAHDQATIVVKTADGSDTRRDKLAAGPNRIAYVGLFNVPIEEIYNVGPSAVEVSIESS
jgi:hypothetical protein